MTRGAKELSNREFKLIAERNVHLKSDSSSNADAFLEMSDGNRPEKKHE
ncbi:hypothetical protein Pan189_33630 [Stratiformator vulcanicus]|uniref:Uncharacterized protein n=1 Tax=Stratiformator vulcanicus TaxID=2527980 RepID=A0A517R565_9PLAN|nr:hypothetical protein Pan189_33630 [Stratiformator vulcanicus]